MQSSYLHRKQLREVLVVESCLASRDVVDEV